MGVSRRRGGVLLAISCLITVMGIGLLVPTVGATPSESLSVTNTTAFSSPEPPAAPTDNEQVVRLPTGGKVSLHTQTGTAQSPPQSASITQVRINNQTYLLPATKTIEEYDRDLFALGTVKTAAERGYWPVIVHTTVPPERLTAAGLENVSPIPTTDAVSAQLPTTTAAKGTLTSLLAAGEITRIEYDQGVRPTETSPRSQSPPASATGATSPINLPPATNLESAEETDPIRVAVVDSGIDTTHPDLRGQVVDRVDLTASQPRSPSNTTDSTTGSTNASAGPRDTDGHGTMVAGVLAGTGTASDGRYRGVAPGVDLIDVRVFRQQGTSRATTVAEGVEYAVREADADIIVMSLEYVGSDSSVIAKSVQWATARDVVVVASAGNRGTGRSITTPGVTPGAITVGASRGDQVASYSSRGPTPAGALKPELLAPGARHVPTLDGGYAYRGGTSIAAPQVAGVAARMLAATPTLSPQAIEHRLVSTARPLPEAHAYAQGGGVIVPERALDPTIVVDGSITDAGLLTTNTTRTRELTVSNHGNRTRTLSFRSPVTNIDTGTDANTTVTLNRSQVRMAPDTQANITVRIHPGRGVSPQAVTGAHSGFIKYTVNRQPRTAVVSFLRGGEITVQKQPLSPTGSTDGDDILAITNTGSHDELLTIENGTAQFVAGGGEYLLWSIGTDAPTGTTVVSAARFRATRSQTVTLNERTTVPVGIDATPLRAAYGPLANLSVTVSASVPEGDGTAQLSRSALDTDSRAVRATPGVDLDVATTYQLATRNGQDRLDARDVFVLGHRSWGVAGPSVETVRPRDVVTTTDRVHRSAIDEQIEAQDRFVISGVWNQQPLRWFGLGTRETQRIHYYPAPPRASYTRGLRSDAWALPPMATDASRTAMRRPFVATVSDIDLNTDTGVAAVDVRPFTGSDGNAYRPRADRPHIIQFDTRGGPITYDRSGARTQIRGPIPVNGTVQLHVSGHNPTARLGTRTQTHLRIDAERPAVRPGLQRLRIPAADSTNAVAPGRIQTYLDLARPNAVINATVWYRVDHDMPIQTVDGTPAQHPNASRQSDTVSIVPPWENATGWQQAPVGGAIDGIRSTLSVPPTAGRGTVSVAATVQTSDSRLRTMTTDAIHVRPAPNTSTRLVTGRVTAADAAETTANDTIMATPVAPETGDRAGKSVTHRVRPDQSYDLDLSRDRTYDIAYIRGDPRTINQATTDRPLIYALQRATIAETHLRLDETIPTGQRLMLRVMDERQQPVENAQVTIEHRRHNATIDIQGTPSADGRVRANASVDGIRLAGNLTVTVAPPEADAYTGDTVTRQLQLTGPVDTTATETIVLNTTPPTATLTASRERMLTGTRVTLDASDSQVPAGAAAYRWDLTDNGTVDQVTDTPHLRYIPSTGVHTPRVTVVDQANKTATAQAQIRVIAPD